MAGRSKSKYENFSVAKIRRILTRAGVKRISPEGLDEFIKVLEEAGIKIAKESVAIAQSSPYFMLGQDDPIGRAPPFSFQRNGVTEEDITIAMRRLGWTMKQS